MRFLPFRPVEYVFLLLIALYMGISAFVAYSHGLGERFHPLMYMEQCVNMTSGLLVIYLFYLCFRILWIMVAIKPKKLARYIWDDWRKGPLNTERLIRALPIFIGFIFFFSAFTSMKQMIPGINPFSWDHEFAVLDNLIHFGIDPWRILHPIFSIPAITYALNVNYNAWLVAVFVALYWQLFSKSHPVERMQFFFAFLLTWSINGTLIATIFSSAGPCFFERLTDSNYYAPLMAHLNEAHQQIKLFAVDTQNMVWNAASKNETMIGGGISAMPSIHVSTAMLFWLLARQIRHRQEWMFIVFFALIVLGSIYLAWHYAVDGYLSIITTFALWHISGWMVRKLMKKDINNNNLIAT